MALLDLQSYIGDNYMPVDEDAYLRDFLKAVMEKNLQYVKFVVPIIKQQMDTVLQSHDGVGHYFEISTEDSSRYRWVLGEGLRMASHHGALDIVEYLLDEGVYINAKDKQGNTPLFKACERKQLQVITKLLKSGANVNITNGVGSTALQWVARRSDLSAVVDILLQWPDTDRDDSSHRLGKTALHCAAELDESGRNVQLLLHHHATVNVQSKDGKAPLHNAVERERLGNVRQLIHQGAHLDIKEHKLGCTPLHLAAQLAFEDIVQELIESGADVNTKDKVGLTPKERMLKYNCLSPRGCDSLSPRGCDSLSPRGHDSLSPRGHDSVTRIVFMLDNAYQSYAQQRAIMLKVFGHICEMIPYDSWKPLCEDIFGGSTLADKVQKKVLESDRDTSLPVLIYKVLCEWLTERLHVATFWVLMMALRDQQLHKISGKMEGLYGEVKTNWEEIRTCCNSQIQQAATENEISQDSVNQETLTISNPTKDIYATNTISWEKSWDLTQTQSTLQSTCIDDYVLS